MKIKIKNFNGELSKLLTVDKVYETSYRTDYTFWIKDDFGIRMPVQLNNCLRLNGGSWEICNA